MAIAIDGGIRSANVTARTTGVGHHRLEPLLPRAAKKLGIPWISLDHQHLLTVSDFSTLPCRFRWRAMFLRLSIPIFYSGQSGEAVSSFQHFPPRRGTQHIPRLGVLLRRTVVEHREQICDQGHVVVYVRKHAPDSLWKALAACGRRAIVYGLGAMSHSQGFDFAATDIQFKNISDEGFVADLASASCLITTAGNQLVGESLFLKKPVLAIPEDGNYEQELNALLVQRSGGGWSIKFEKLTSHLLGCWAECEVLPNAIYTLDIVRPKKRTIHAVGSVAGQESSRIEGAVCEAGV